MRAPRARACAALALTALLAGLLAVLLPGGAGAVTGGTISGHVSGKGFALTGLVVSVDYGTYTAPVAADGSYTVTGVPKGSRNLALTHHADQDDASTADYGSVTVANGATLTRNLAFTRVSGKVTERGTTKPVGNVEIQVATTGYSVVGYGADAADGTYEALVPVTSKKYLVSFYPHDDNFYYQFAGNTSRESEATRFTFSSTAQRTINISLPRAAVLRGSLTLPKGSSAVQHRVQLYRKGHSLSGEPDQELWVDGKGAFAQGPVEPGSYTVSFGRASGFALAPGRFYNGKSEASTSPTKVTFTAGKSTKLAAQVAKASLGGKLSGTVYTVAGGKHVGRKGLRVVAVPTSKNLSTRSATTGTGGKYTIPGLTPGTYKVYVWNAKEPFPGEKGYTQKKLGSYAVKAGRTTAVGSDRFDPKTKTPAPEPAPGPGLPSTGA